MTFIDITCMSDRSEEVIIETFPRRNDTPLFTTQSCRLHSCIPPLCAIMCCMYTVYSGMQEWVIQIPSIPILVSVLFPSLHLKYCRIKFLLLVGYRGLVKKEQKQE